MICRTAGLAGALLWAAFGAGGVAAATVTFGLVGVVTETTRAGEWAPKFNGEVGVGTFAFDAGSVLGIGNEVVSGRALEIDFRIFDQDFSAADDRNFGQFPALLLRDGTPRAIDFGVSEEDGNPVDLVQPMLRAFFTDPLYELDPLGDRTFGVAVTAVSIAPIPLPAALPLALAGAGHLVFVGRRRRRG
jgi:hypothetical protein